jgi:hypothetical protein
MRFMLATLSRIASRFLLRLVTHRPSTIRTRTPVPRFRPRVEGLERRDVPAGTEAWWIGDVSSDATNPANWEGDPTDGHIFFAGPDAGPIGKNDRVPTGVDCENFHGSFFSISVQSTYSGTITLNGAVTTKTFGMESGTIDQPVSGTDITVTGPASLGAPAAFVWTGGTLNSTANDATVNILDNGTITLPTGGILNCGSSLNFANANPGGRG